MWNACFLYSDFSLQKKYMKIERNAWQIEKKLAKDKNDNYLPRSSSSSSSNSNSTMKSLSEMTPLADYWTCKYCGLENPKEARYCQHCGGDR